MAYHIITVSPDGSKIGRVPVCRELIEDNPEFKATFTVEPPHLTRWTCEDSALAMLARVNVPNFAIRDKTADRPDCMHHLFLFALRCKLYGLCKKLPILHGWFAPEHCKQCAFEERSHLRHLRHSMCNLPDVMLIQCRSWSAYVWYDGPFMQLVCQASQAAPPEYKIYTIEINGLIYPINPRYNDCVYQKMIHSQAQP